MHDIHDTPFTEQKWKWSVDEGDDKADWKKICQEEGIDITSGKGEPIEEAVEECDDAPTNEKITSMWV